MNQTTDADLTDSYKSCKRSLAMEHLDEDCFNDKIRGRYLSRVTFEKWWEFELKSNGRCGHFFVNFSKEYEMIKASLTDLHDGFKKGDYKVVYDQLPEKTFVDEVHIFILNW